MKKLIIGLSIACIAMVASTLTNAKSNSRSSVFITGFSGTTYTYTTSPRPCEGVEHPCLVEAVGLYIFPTTGIPIADLNNRQKIRILSYQDNF